MSGPGFSHDLRQRQTHSLVLSPQLRQSLKILQVAALDLRATIQEELQANPTIEELPMEGESLEPSDSAEENSDENGAADNSPTDADSAAGDADSDSAAQREELDFTKQFEILGKIDEDWRSHLSREAGAQTFTGEDAEKRQHFMDSLVSETSLQEHLMQQAEMADLAPPVLAAMRLLVGSIDDRGYLTQKPADIALQSGLPLESVQSALQTLRAFEPAGIGATDLADCLYAQLVARDRHQSLAGRMIREQFDLLTRRRIPDLARRLDADSDDIQSAIEEIGKLDPAPGRRFAEDNNRVVVPDVIVERDGAEWKITLNSDYIPRLRLSSTYRQLVAKGALSKEEKDYLRERMRSGKFLIDSIEQRQRTVERVTREIVRAQTGFFEHGVSHLRSLTMSVIADAVGVHETTVSRAVANKFMQTPHGVFEFRYFFTTGYESAAGATVSNTSVKELIADLVNLENRAAPLSDHEIVAKLAAKGITLARRTVAKYRDALGILPSNLRRDYK